MNDTTGEWIQGNRQADTASASSGSRSAGGKKLIVFSAPSGAGKTTIARKLLERHSDWSFSVSATTRPQRPGERNGYDYYFLTDEEFRKKVKEGELVEWEEVFGNLYGTLKSEIARLLSMEETGRVLFDVDVKGALSIQRAFPDDVFLVFIATPSLEELRRRLYSRGTDSKESIDRRIQRATEEMEMSGNFDVVVVNDDLDRTVDYLDGLLIQ